jgi:sugar transferase (PEP-CTERM system associated)
MSTVRFFSPSTYFFRYHIPTEFVILGLLEAFALIGAFYIGVDLRLEGQWQEALEPLLPKALIYVVVMQLCMIAFGVYQRESQRSLNLLAVRITGSILLGIVVLGMVYYIAPVFLMWRSVLVISAFVSFVLVMAIRVIFFRITKAYDLRLRVLVLGSGDAAGLVREVAANLTDINFVNYIPMPGDNLDGKETGVEYPTGALIQYARDKRIDVIVLAMDERRKGLPLEDLLDCKMSGLDVLDMLTFFERFTSKIRLDIMNPSWLIHSEGFQVNIFRRILKRLFDLTAVLLILPFALPIAGLSMLAILVESGFKGPVLYGQTRVSENGRLFKIYKFRSMVNNAEQDGVARWATENDSRITRVGAFLRKFRIDELPQLFNVLKGEMSFVGPRPERPEFVERLAKKIPYYHERHRVKPGLTGWAQIRYPYGASEEDGQEKLQYDLYYVKNCSLILDALVLLQTAEVVLLGKGAR